MVDRFVIPFVLALRFLTIIPVPLSVEITSRRTGRAMAWFPVVGLIIGGILVLVDRALAFVFPPLVNAGLLLVVWVGVTGALHFDGFVDCCDGLFAAKSPEQRLEILRDIHLGSYAVVGAVCLLLIKFALLVVLPGEYRIAALLVTPALARAAIVYAARAFPYARRNPGLGQFFRETLTWREVIIAVSIAVGAAGVALTWRGLVLALWVWALTVGIAAWGKRRIGGLTGDVYGAIAELTEVGALLCTVLIARVL